MSTKSWSAFQTAIFTAVSTILTDRRDLVVLARAGTGKTTTMVEAVIRLCRANPNLRVLTCAFNVKNARELDSRLSDAGLDWRQASAKTLNSVGLATCKKAWGKGVSVDGQKGRRIAKDLAREYGSNPENMPIAGLPGKIARLATMAKITLTPDGDFEAMRELCRRFAITDSEDEVSPVINLAWEAMGCAADDRMVVDFDDQLWFPHVFRLTPWQNDVVIVDEAQDMNASQLALARKSVKTGGRLIAVGDDRQAIYGWRGADSEFMGRMVSELNAQTLPLPRTYRCGKSIVAEAQKLVPDYEAAETNGDGIVRADSFEKMLAGAGAGDFILSRLNAPLLGICLNLLKRRVPAVIQGRDIMGQLIALIEKSECVDTACLLQWVNGYEADERAKLVAADAEDEHFVNLHDRCECIRSLASERATCRELVDYLGELFSDRDDTAKVTLSTAHRAKGMERDRVWLLNDTFRSGGQEDNVRYVAITRAKDELVYVTA